MFTPCFSRAARNRAATVTAARLLGMTQQRLSSLESGRVEPKARDVALVARLTGVDPVELLMGDERDPIEVPDDPASYRRPNGQDARGRNLASRQATHARPPKRPDIPPPAAPVWRPANLGRDVRPAPKETQ